MRQEADILVRGRHERPLQEPEEVETRAKGAYLEKEDTIFLSYKDVDEESGEVTDNLIRYQEGKMEVTKKGQATAKMVFNLRRKTETDYQTGYGILRMFIRTYEMRVTKTENKVTFMLKYAIAWDESDSDTGMSTLTIEADLRG